MRIPLGPGLLPRWRGGGALSVFPGDSSPRSVPRLDHNRAMQPELIRRLPKTDLHVHLDGSLRLTTLIELARERRVPLPSQTEEGLRAQVFRPRYRDLGEYLEGFRYLTSGLLDAESLHQASL